MPKIIIRQIALPPDADRGHAVERAAAIARKNGINTIKGCITRFSVDSRKKNDIKFVYSVMLECDGAVSENKLKATGAELYREPALDITYGSKERCGKIAVIGFGPAGMFASLTLAENGYIPVVFERGRPVDERSADIERFLETRTLDTESNIQFGAGGAGTFSDGKLITRINDPACSVVLERLVSFGAPEDILTNARPHIGTDVLKTVIRSVTDRLRDLGADIRFGCKVTSVRRYGDGLTVDCAGSSEYYDAAILCTGHSARDTYKMLYDGGVSLEKKPFSVGCRVEHLREDIDRAMYGEGFDKYKEFLPHAEYNLSTKLGGRGVYSFCMCPGGKVICASTEEDGVVTNGMSYHKRDGLNSNSAVAVSVYPEDLSENVLSGIDFQRAIERAAFIAAGGGFNAPCQTLGSFLHGKSSDISKIVPSYEPSVSMCDTGAIFPSFITENLRTAFFDFDRKIHGFASDSAVITSPETRTSAPVRILRNALRTSPDIVALYPCGEGSGYAGGITSAAADGINTAVEIMKKYKPDKT